MPNRRSEDRDRMLTQRLEQLEASHAALTRNVAELQSGVNVVKLEQVHLKELLTSQLKIIEKAQELQLSRTEQLSKDIQTMSSDAERTPMGRDLGGKIEQVQIEVVEHREKHDQIERWKNQIDGAILLLKWIGAAGLVSLGLTILRWIKMLP